LGSHTRLERVVGGTGWAEGTSTERVTTTLVTALGVAVVASEASR
jgi:hypothetical protein